jgi:hypothetical protein
MDPAISYILTIACLIGLTTWTMFLVLYERSLSRQAKLLEEMGSIAATRAGRGVSEVIGYVPLLARGSKGRRAKSGVATHFVAEALEPGVAWGSDR